MSAGTLAHQLQFEGDDLGEEVVVVVETEFVQLFVVDSQVDILVFEADLHFGVATGGPGKKQFYFGDVIDGEVPVSDVNGLLLELQKLLEPDVDSLLGGYFYLVTLSEVPLLRGIHPQPSRQVQRVFFLLGVPAVNGQEGTRCEILL